ncbi:hypothetical protein PINS_up013763 [Pythium insidiosum]|nr:hypothetical protein PINS_up013763 [Pythium insidiosum]
MSRIPQLTPRKPRLRPLPATPEPAAAPSTSSFVNTQARTSSNVSAIPSLLKTDVSSSRLRFQPASRFVRQESKPSNNNQEEAEEDRESLRDETEAWSKAKHQHESTVTLMPISSTAISSSTLVAPMKTDNIRVLLRIRPPRPSDNNRDADDFVREEELTKRHGKGTRRCLDVGVDGQSIMLAPTSVQEKRFAFDRVFDEFCSQEDVFQDAGLMAVENALNGFNGCIFAYGQTGSGKTFTMLGGSSQHHDAHELKVSPMRGLMPRIFDHLFRRLDELASDETSDLEYTLTCSYLEIYNEKVFDLLEVNAVAAQQPKHLREDSSKKTVYVDQLRRVSIKSAAEAIELLQVGSRNRRMASTEMNRESSRSHAVFTLQLIQTHHTDRGVLITRRSNLHLVDLAGSEKQRQTKAEGQRLKEAAQINKSLSALGNVINALVDVSNGLKRHVHYRDSKLTFLLRDSLGGNAITTIIATISAEESFFGETLSTLKFAQRAKFIKNKAVQNEDSDAIVPLLKEEIERLRLEIVRIKSLHESHGSNGIVDRQTSHIALSDNQGKENRWEPALEVMLRLLKAAGGCLPRGS